MHCYDIRCNRILTLTAISFLVMMILGGVASAAPVKVEGGLLEGTVEGILTVYRGIPYAAPPSAAQSNAIPPADLGAALPQGLLKRSKTSQLFEAMDWAKMQNGKAGSPYQGKLDPAAIAVMGGSCGGLQALEA